MQASSVQALHLRGILLPLLLQTRGKIDTGGEIGTLRNLKGEEPQAFLAPESGTGLFIASPV